jgi:hypothetical protein
VVFHFLVQNWQEFSQQLTNIFDDFFGFVHSMAKKSMKKCFKSSNADKNGLGEYQPMSFRPFLLTKNPF